MRAAAIVWCAVGVLGGACNVGEGEGFVSGELALSESCEEDGEHFDLNADYFAGDFFDDDTDKPSERDTLTVRVQNSAESGSVTDALTIQVINTAAVKPRQPIDVVAGCIDAVDCPVRASLSLYRTCAEAFVPLVAQGNSACPETVDVDSLCDGDFGAHDPYRSRLEEAMPADVACVVFCELGNDFGEQVAAAFRFRMIDDRTDEEVGSIIGRFSFELTRGRSSQLFP